MSTTGKAESYIELKGSLSTPDAITGKSAYEIAVMHGFKGTEEEWIKSLKGDEGATPYIGDNNNWHIGETDTGIQATGVVVEQSVYVGSGTMPEGFNVQVDPTGRAISFSDDFVLSEAGEIKLNESISSAKIEAHEKRITNLEKNINGTQFVTDSTVAYTKEAPHDSLPYAEVGMIGGMSRKCTNLVDVADVTINGIGAYAAQFIGDFALPSGTYTLSASYVHSGAASGSISIRSYGNDNDYIGDAHIQAGTSGTTSKTFTVAEGTKGIRLYFYSNATGTATGTSVAISEVMVNEGVTALPYEPYFAGLGSSPVTEIESASANLFNPADYMSDAVNTTLDGDVFTTTFTNASLHLNPSRTRAFKAGTYTVHIERVSPTLKLTLLAYEPGTYTTIHSVAIDDGGYIQIYAEKDFAIALTGYYTGDGSKYGTFSYRIQVTKGDTPMPYAPYSIKRYLIPENVQELEGYGEGINANYHNYIKWGDDGTRTYHKMVKTIVLDGVTYGYRMDGTDPQAAGLEHYYAYMLSPAISLELGTPCKISHGVYIGDVPNPTDYDVVANTSGVFSLSIKADVLGLGDAPTYIEITNAINKYLNDRYNEGNPVMVTYVLPSNLREVTDISYMLSEDNFVDAGGGGTLTFKNEHETAVPSEITYMLKGA